MSKAVKQVNLNIEELKSFLTHIVNNNRFLQKSGKTPAAVEIQGESGLGKTSGVLQLANELSLNFVKLNLAQIEELGDLIGFPVREYQLCTPGNAVPVVASKKVKAIAAPAGPVKKMVKKMVDQEVTVMEEQEVEEFETKMVPKQILENGKFVTKQIETKVAVKVKKEVMEAGSPAAAIEESHSIANPSSENCLWIDEHAIEEYLKQGYSFTGLKRMSYCPPEWIADKQGGGILILDDWNRADIRFIQAVMELVDRQEYISWKLPKDWHIMLTANPDDGNYLVQSIDNAQRTRFISVNLKFSVDVWAKWAEEQGIDGRCINFMLMHPELITEKINPRSVTTFFNAISSIKDFAADLPLIQMIGEGSVGPEFALLFSSFINNRLDKLITPHDILLHDNEMHVVSELRKAIGTGADYRADIASILTTRTINYGIHYAENNTIYQKTIDRLIKLATDPDTLTDDLKYILVKKFLNGNKQKFQKMMVHPEVIKMSMK
jgi:MoxR-like ATPase